MHTTFRDALTASSAGKENKVGLLLVHGNVGNVGLDPGVRPVSVVEVENEEDERRSVVVDRHHLPTSARPPLRSLPRKGKPTKKRMILKSRN